ncbi:MAG: hypothetical protein HPY66_1363 [Firmicutes bacterium]|nr:hypothetical protein [Bacillota bacterium]
MEPDIANKYVNAAAYELISDHGFSILKINADKPACALVEKRGERLEVVFFDFEVSLTSYIEGLLPGLMRFMDTTGCRKADLSAIHVGAKDEPGADHSTYSSSSRLQIAEIRVDLDRSAVIGSSGNETVDGVLKKLSDSRVLDEYRPKDLEAEVPKRTRKKPVPMVTYAILSVNFILWMLMTMAGGSTNSSVLIRFGAMYSPLIAQGQYWRLVTPMFLHVGLVHLSFNSYALYQLGSLSEIIFGRVKFIIIYFAAGLCGSVSSFLFTKAVSAGASGAIFGLLGALLYFGKARPGVLNRGFIGNIATIIGINLFIGFTYPGIDNFAHIGGLAGGYAASMVILKYSDWR